MYRNDNVRLQQRQTRYRMESQILNWNRRKLLIGLFTVSTVYLVIQSVAPIGRAHFQRVE